MNVASPSLSEGQTTLDGSGGLGGAARGATQGLAARDAQHLWHPYAQVPARAPALPVRAAEGAWLSLEDGRRVLDGMSSWWCACHGHRHPHIVAAVERQLRALPHVMFGGLTHAPAVELAERLIAMSPAGLEHVFLADSDSGSVSVEVAIKMVLQAGAAERRTRLAALRGGYHGDTFGAMALCDPEGGMHRPWAGTLAEHLFLPRPPDGFDAPVDLAWRDEAGRSSRGTAASPPASSRARRQGAAGMHVYAPAYLTLLRELCDRHGVLLVFDEITTGFGRTGTVFAAAHAGVPPDVMCVGKALTGATLTLAAGALHPGGRGGDRGGGGRSAHARPDLHG